MTKPHLNSRILWVNLIAAIVGILIAAGVDVPIDGETQVAIAGVIVMFINFGLRLVTKHELTSSTNDDDPMQGDLSETKRE